MIPSTRIVFLGIGRSIRPSNCWRSKFCKFFDYIEHKFHVRIIIAAHPKSNYDAKSDYYQGRTIIKGDTARLVKDSSFVIASQSTAINLAILFNKPAEHGFQRRCQPYFAKEDLIAYIVCPVLPLEASFGGNTNRQGDFAEFAVVRAMRPVVGFDAVGVYPIQVFHRILAAGI